MKKTQKGQKHKLDKIFSEYIRRRNADASGYVSCVTCGKKDHWKNMDAGHYVSRRHNATRWDESNVHVQCPGCNRFRNGAPDEYAIYLKQAYPYDILEELHRKKHTISKWTQKDYEDAIEYYKEELEFLDTGKRKCPYCEKWYKRLEKHIDTH